MVSAFDANAPDRALRPFATRRPEWFAVLTSLAYMLPPLTLRLLAPQAASVAATANPLQVAQMAWVVLVPATLLSGLGWWSLAGFTRRSTWRSLIPFLPLIVLYMGSMVALPILFGVASHSLGYFVLVAVAALAVGFGDEATFRGVVLQALLPRGAMRAVVFSSVLYGAQYLGTIAAGVDPVLVGVQAVHMLGIGVAFAALVVVTGTIWPLVFITAVGQTATLILPEGTSSPDIFTIAFELVMGALAAAYGIWLLHRQQHPARRLRRRSTLNSREPRANFGGSGVACFNPGGEDDQSGRPADGGPATRRRRHSTPAR